MPCTSSASRSGHVVAVVVLLAAVLPCRADVGPADYMSIRVIRAIGSTANELGYATSKINATSFKQQSLTTFDAPDGTKYQFVSYYDASEKLVVGRRTMLDSGWSDWYLRRTAFTSNNINDAHDVSSIAVDGDGYLHVSWGMHNNSLLYTRSATPAIGEAAFTLVGDTVGNSGGLRSEFSLTSGVTYPMFHNVPGSGDILFSYRTGVSGNGDAQLFRWNNAADQWNPVRASTTAPWIDGDYAGDSLPSVNAYTNYAAWDDQGRLHVTWTWRTGGDSPTPFKDYQSNHNLMYAWSPNQGVDWYRQDGTLYERSGAHAIDESNASPVVAIPEGSSLINQTHMATGPDGTVYVASWWAPNAAEGDHLRQYMLAWRDGDTWRTSRITHRNPENTNASGVSQRVPESALSDFRMSRPIVLVDDSDRVIVAFTDWQRNKKLTVAYSEDADRDDWQIFELPTWNMGSWEASLDVNRWKNDGVMSLFYQVVDVGQSASTVSVLEWNARAYFAALEPAPGDANGDGCVNAADAAVLAAHWFGDATDGPSQGDFNRDGRVDDLDLAILSANWQDAPGAPALPEPASAVLLVLGLATLLIWKRGACATGSASVGFQSTGIARGTRAAS
ncbi:MAG: BNR-4 repeat-containing protein [Pirellulales bacterium]|nr:BNR-4 repeat-containing protein [Pirellulales bacterium]